MKKQKLALITKISTLKKDEIYKLSKLPYSKVFVLYNWDNLKNIKIPSKVSLVPYTNVNNTLNKLFKENLSYKFLPYFVWDDNSKYSIKVFNHTFWSKVDHKIFKEKDKMTNFLWEVAHKKYVRLTYKELQNKTYDEIKEIVWDSFIIKPTNASSSTSTFIVREREDFSWVLWKIAKSYDYIVEEYILWDLLSLDFFFDWENIFMLCFAREIAMIELFDKSKFSKEFLSKYGEEITKHFNFILPLAYNQDFSKISKTELVFLEELRKKLKSVSYRWVIHLEYKYDSVNEKVGFIEWGARFGWYRKIFIKELYNTEVLKLNYYLLEEKDLSRFAKVKNNIYKFKEKEHDLNFVRVKTNFLQKTNLVSLLKKSWNLITNSFDSFMKEYYEDNFWIETKKIDFYIKHSKDYNFYPFYKNNTTKFDYILEFNDDNFKLFKKKNSKL